MRWAPALGPPTLGDAVNVDAARRRSSGPPEAEIQAINTGALLARHRQARRCPSTSCPSLGGSNEQEFERVPDPLEGRCRHHRGLAPFPSPVALIILSHQLQRWDRKGISAGPGGGGVSRLAPASWASSTTSRRSRRSGCITMRFLSTKAERTWSRVRPARGFNWRSVRGLLSELIAVAAAGGRHGAGGGAGALVALDSRLHAFYGCCWFCAGRVPRTRATSPLRWRHRGYHVLATRFARAMSSGLGVC